MKALILVMCAATLALAAPVPKEAKRDDLDRIEGEWWEARFNEIVHAETATARRFRFNKDGTAGIYERVGAEPYRYEFAIDQSTTPPSFTWNPKIGRGKYIASYRIEGDMLFIVFTDAAKPIAKEVKPGAGDVYYELKRVK